MDKIQTLLDILYQRRSVRKFQEDRPVEREKIELLLHAAMAAPSACNLQPWEFVVVDRPEGVAALKNTIGETNGRYYNAPAALVVCGNTSYIPWENNTGIVDCAAAIENLLLAATVLELGAVWIGDYDEDEVRALLDIPEHVRVNSLVLLGYPAQGPLPRTQYTGEAVYWQTYDPERPHAPRTIAGQLQLQ